ncbi:hypothetical protein RN22_08855 [Grimontia sp. AD028]|uniref:hypothetical protein n=1 Tax=Grimontia sp. AD028 TaxID=1581149 RepID=UPI00061AF0DB|nr:hypothetical protein [Grimontia sp. AD028]KKD60841.1 hypothetical protein RN22_08855 [Grimontia sp. AD028]
MEMEYKQAVDVLAQLKVGTELNSALKSEASEVVNGIFHKHCTFDELSFIREMLDTHKVTPQLRNSWTDIVCDVWQAQEI